MADRFGAPMIVLAAVAFSLIAGVVEMMCIPSEEEQYYKDYGDQASGVDGKQSK